jgi:hypothetical protein
VPKALFYMRFFRDAAITLACLVLTLLVLEAGLRIAGVRYTASFFTTERERGYAMRPNAEGWEAGENENFVRLNREGNYDRERTLEVPAGTLRIAVIGSSEAEAQQVPLEKTFEAVIERKLQQAGLKQWRNVEVMNFGVPGYGMAQEYLTLHNRVWKYHPQIVLLATTAFVLLTNTRDLYPFPGQTTPFFDFENGVLVLDAETRAAPPLNQQRLLRKNRLSDLMNRSYLLLMLNEARANVPDLVHQVTERWSPRPKQVLRPGSPPLGYQGTWPYLPNLPAMQKSWRIADGLLGLMKQDCDEHGAEFWLIGFDMVMQVHPDLAARETFRKSLGVASLYESDERLAAIATAKSIHSLLLAPILADYASTHHVALHGFFNTKFNDGHWNELGHQVAGEGIARELLNSSSVIRGSTDESARLKASN